MCSILALAETVASPQVPRTREDSTTPIAFGQSVVSLDGPWKFTVGDSPLDPQTGQSLWAEPGFDHSRWEKVELTPEIGSFDPIIGTTGYVSGWTARGHAGYWGCAAGCR